MPQTLGRRTRVTTPALMLSTFPLRLDIGSGLSIEDLARSLNRIAILKMISITMVALPVCRSPRPDAPKSSHLAGYSHRQRQTLVQHNMTRALRSLTHSKETRNGRLLHRTRLQSAEHTPAAHAAPQVSSHMGRRRALRAPLSGQTATASPAVDLAKKTTSLSFSR